jgi:hypothetical protein
VRREQSRRRKVWFVPEAGELTRQVESNKFDKLVERQMAVLRVAQFCAIKLGS